MFLVPSCAILLWMSRRSCSVTQNSMRIGLVRSAIGYSPSFKLQRTNFYGLGGTPKKIFPLIFQRTVSNKNLVPAQKNFLSLYNGHSFRRLAGTAGIKFSRHKLVPLTLQRTNFCELGGIPKNSFHFTTDIFSEKNRGLLDKSENKSAPGLGKSGSIVFYGYEILENSKHSRCPYTAAK